MTVKYCERDEYNLSSFHTSTTHMSLINYKFYCNVLTTRSVEQSHPVGSIVQEVKELVVQGYKEVSLLGQNIDENEKDMIPKKCSQQSSGNNGPWTSPKSQEHFNTYGAL
eukprot:4927134-Ditylum_brightwellii.AAC.1